MLRVEVTASSPLLKRGLAFIDTPGVGGHGQPHLSATLGLLPDADAMLMISDTSQEFTEPEMTFIRQAHEICPVAAIVATKTDLYPHWREIVAANHAHLQRAGLSASDDSGVVAAAQPRPADTTTRNSTRNPTFPPSSSSSARRCCPGRTTGFAIRCSPRSVRLQSI